jgi:hypothetical protein
MLFVVGHLTFCSDALTLVYVVGYTIHKLGQLEDYCIDCYTRLVNPSHSAEYLRLIRHLGNNFLVSCIIS